MNQSKINSGHALVNYKMVVLAICLVFTGTLIFSGIAAAFSGSGAGTEGNPSQITNCAQLQEMQDELDAHYILMNDIDCSDTVNWNAGAGFEPIGDNNDSFTGTFDGQGFKVTDMYINRSGQNFVGLFGHIGESGIVQNLGIETMVIADARDFVGSLAGRNSGDILRAYVNGSVMVPDDCCEYGGLVGNNRGTISQSYTNVDIVAMVPVGGLVGYHEEGTISDSYALGTVEATDELAGGLVGAMEEEAIIERSYAVGQVIGDGAGGLVGEWKLGTVLNSFWDIDTSNQGTSNGGTGLTTEEMKTLATFTTDLGEEAWDFDEIWAMDESEAINDGYPYLQWQEAVPNPEDDLNVAELTDPVTSKKVILEVDTVCTIQDAGMSAESANSIQDPGFDYPVGLVNFSTDCGTPGYTTTVTLYYYGVTNEDFVLRKHNPNSNAYFNVAGASFEQTTISGQTVLKVGYQATDGGELDIDGTANGIIVDPVGLAQSVVGVPNTGLGGRLYN